MKNDPCSQRGARKGGGGGGVGGGSQFLQIEFTYIKMH